ncbi:MAG: HDOD domain-containing protein [Verrucomicrobium sp.]|nr:HDOD domain-containing protein [Verrucomicrobium sp.]
MSQPVSPSSSSIEAPARGGTIDLIDNLDEMPSLPMSYLEIKREVNNPASSLSRIGEVISKDQSLTLRLLRLANSAFFGFPRRIDTISEAISVIGLQQVRDLALCTKVIEMFRGIPADLLETTPFWMHSVGCGIAARVLAAHQRETNLERFFVAGLLHDVGRLVLCLRQPEAMRNILQRARQQKEPLHKVEREFMGYDHTDVGAALLKAWDLPAPLVNAVSYHHRPLINTASPNDAAIIHLADIFAHGMELGKSGEHYVPPLASGAWKREPTVFNSAMKEIDRQFAEVSGIFLSLKN